MSRTRKVLFFGRKDCEFTARVYDLLLKSGVASTLHLSEKRGEFLPDHVLNWSGDYIFSFRNLVVLPKRLIASASEGAINFHPGPPEYPGSGCTNFALYDDAKAFGVTAHLMEQVVDSGAILDVRKFNIEPDDTVETLTRKVHWHLYSLAIEVIPKALADDHWVRERAQRSEQSFRWSGTRRKITAVDTMRRISPSMSKTELNRRVRAIHHVDFPLYFEMHGRIFNLASSELPNTT